MKLTSSASFGGGSHPFTRHTSSPYGGELSYNTRPPSHFHHPSSPSKGYPTTSIHSNHYPSYDRSNSYTYEKKPLYTSQYINGHDLETELKVKSHLLDNTRESFTKLASALGISEHELQQLKLNEFARVPVNDFGVNPESSVEMNLRRIISMAHDLGGMTSTSGCDAEIAALQYELGTLCKSEIQMKDIHKQKLMELEDSWDKLVSLRRHISIFRSQIEETTIEDIHNQAFYSKKNGGGWKTKNVVEGKETNSEVKVSSANKQIHFHILREKLHIRSQIENSIQEYEKKLESLREEIRKYSSILMESSHVLDKMPNALALAASSRQKLQSTSQLLQETEEEYINLRQQLLNLNTEISESLQMVENEEGVDFQEIIRENHLSSLKADSNAVGTFSWTNESTKSDDLAVRRAYAEDPSLTRVQCDFTLSEVLEGKAYISRLMGESAVSYRGRLQKRLNGLMILCAQLQHEVDLKSIEVKDARDQVRDLEVKRLRLELQVANICTILQQRKTFVESHYYETEDKHPLLEKKSRDRGHFEMPPSTFGKRSNHTVSDQWTHDRNSLNEKHHQTKRWSHNPYERPDDPYRDIDPSTPTKSAFNGNWIICPPSKIGSSQADPPVKKTVENVRDHARDVMNVAVQLLQTEYYSPQKEKINPTQKQKVQDESFSEEKKQVDEERNCVEDTNHNDKEDLSKILFEDDVPANNHFLDDDELTKLVDSTLARVDDLTIKTASFTPPPKEKLEPISNSSAKKSPLSVEKTARKRNITPRALKYSMSTDDLPPRSVKKSSKSLSPVRGRDTKVVVTPNSSTKHISRELRTTTKKKTRVLSKRSYSSDSAVMEPLTPDVLTKLRPSSPYDTIKSSELLSLSPRKSRSPSHSPPKTPTPEELDRNSPIPEVEKSSTIAESLNAQSVSAPNVEASITQGNDSSLISALSVRLNKVADDAVIKEFGITGLRLPTQEIQMKRQEAVIEELLSILLEGGLGDGHHDNIDISNFQDANLDEVLFLLRNQQQELQEIRERKILNSRLNHHMEEEQNASDYFNAPRHSSSPDEEGHHDRRSRSPHRSVSRWIGGGTSNSHHLQGKDNKFIYAPTNLPHSSKKTHSRSASPPRATISPDHPLDAYHSRLSVPSEHSSPIVNQDTHGSSPLKDIANIATQMVKITKEIALDSLPAPPPPSTHPPFRLSKVEISNSKHSTPSPVQSKVLKSTPILTPYQSGHDHEDETSNSVWNISGSSCEEIPQEELRPLPSVSSFIVTKPHNSEGNSALKSAQLLLEKSNSLLTETADGYSVLDHPIHNHDSASFEDPLISALSPDHHFKYPFSSNRRKNSFDEDQNPLLNSGEKEVRRSPSPKKKSEFFSHDDLVEEIHPQSSKHKSESMGELKSQLTRAQEKLLEAETEKSNTPTFGRLDITLMNIREMPETKKLSNGADCYLELTIDYPNGDGTFYDFPASRQRTLTKWNEKYPNWRDEPKVLQVVLDDQQMISKGALMSVILKNASKSGNDEMIARALLPLTALLDQRKHNYWLKFHPPIESKSQKYARSKPRLPDNCAIRVDAKLIYSKIALWRSRIEEIEGKIKHLDEEMKNPPQSRDPFIRVRSRKPSKDEEFNKEEIEFNQAKKIERKIMKVMQKTPQSAPERLTSRSTSPQKMSKNKVLPRNSRQENERKMIITPSHERNEDEPHESPPIISSEEEDKPSIVSKVKTPPPNLSIFRGGGVKMNLLQGNAKEKLKNSRKKIGFGSGVNVS